GLLRKNLEKNDRLLSKNDNRLGHAAARFNDKNVGSCPRKFAGDDRAGCAATDDDVVIGAFDLSLIGCWSSAASHRLLHFKKHRWMQMPTLSSGPLLSNWTFRFSLQVSKFCSRA
ncbi:MAG: hypothetical protein WBG13_07425, partial [Pseudolabrys sp.]